MKFCKYCGAQISEEETICPKCGGHLSPNLQADEKAADASSSGFIPTHIIKKAKDKFSSKKAIVIAGIVVVIAILVLTFVLNSGKCHESGCSNKVVPGSDYCYSHKCALSSCSNRRLSFSNYCVSHYSLYDDDAEKSSSYVSSYMLEISNVRLSSSSNYTTAEGTITNNSNATVSFVKIKGAFENSSGTVVDTDWTYAVGSEGLAPGESCKWRMSVSKDSSIRKCSVTIFDFDY